MTASTWAAMSDDWPVGVGGGLVGRPLSVAVGVSLAGGEVGGAEEDVVGGGDEAAAT
jgi:hypothetical protein